ncbi:MAG: ParB/RepB/Spo0J family partition protein [Chloroflexi bacterium]|nr:ParB/RepB/Spo0J family partition protein [Chloroflexota bacterium]
MARRGLGKGLEALIPGDTTQEPSGGTNQIPIDQIRPNPSQPRMEMSDEGLQDLAASIREHGIIQPLILTRDNGENHFTLIAGERRLRAAKIAGLESVPAIIREASEQERLELALIENIQRENLTPLESAEAYQRLNDEFGLHQEQIAERVGKSRVAVTNTIRLLKLPDEAKKALNEGKISEGHARALLGLSTAQAQSAALQTIVKNELNVRQAEELVRKLSGIKPQTDNPKATKSPEVRSVEEKLRSHLGTKVSLYPTGKGGTITIHYYSEEELESLIKQLSGE